MSVYDRAMFRGSRPTGQPVKQAEQMLMRKTGEKVMSDAMSGIASAKDPVQLMNAMRGDERTMKERRQELGGIVGMKDANKTPESVVTLVQPVMQMREAQGAVDQGIGRVAQKAMDTPVTEAVQKGIMQPLKMQKAGEVSLQRLYEQNLPMVQAIYGGDEEADRKQALANLLLGGLAPAGLAIAQGTPVAEALMPIGPMLATSGASVKQAKDKRDLAARSAALQMATSDRDRILAARAKASEGFNLGPDQVRFRTDPDTGETKEIARGPQKKEYTTVYKLDPNNSMGFVTKDILKSAETPEDYSRSKPDVGGYSIMMNRNTGKLKKGTDLYFAQNEGTFTEPQPNTLIDVFDAEGKKQKIPYSQYLTQITSFSLEDPTEKVTVYPLQDIKVGDRTITAGTSVSLSKSFVDDQPDGTFSTEPPVDLMSKMKVVYKRGDNGALESKVTFDPEEYADLINNQGFTPNTPEKFQFVPMFKMVDGKAQLKTATSFAEQNTFIQEGFRPYTEEYKTLGNKVLSISPVGTTVLYTNLESDPATLFNASGEPQVVANKKEALAARKKGFHFTKKPEMKGITRSFANALLVNLSDKIASGQYSPKELREFQTAISVVRDTPRVVTGEGGESMVTVGGTVPPFAVEAVRLAKERDPEFNDMGLLDVPIEEVAGVENYEGIIDPTINYAESIGPRNKVARATGSFIDFFKSLGGADYDPTFAGSFEAVNDIQMLNVITVTRSLKALGGKASNELRQRLETLQVDPFSAGLTKTKLLSSVTNMRTFLSDTLVTLNDKKQKAPTPSSAEKIRADIGELEYLLGQYELLETNLKSQSGTFGSGSVRPQDAPSLSVR